MDSVLRQQRNSETDQAEAPGGSVKIKSQSETDQAEGPGRLRSWFACKQVFKTES
ncbi:hypothetical protein GCM10008915_12190 [Bifidobacterium pullorum subsp. gallinarum]